MINIAKTKLYICDTFTLYLEAISFTCANNFKKAQILIVPFLKFKFFSLLNVKKRKKNFVKFWSYLNFGQSRLKCLI